MITDPTTVWLGKDGTTPEWIANLKQALKRHKLIKVKVQKRKREGLEELISQVFIDTNAYLVKKIGFTFTLRKKGV